MLIRQNNEHSVERAFSGTKQTMIKGTALHEILNLPSYWSSMAAVPDNGMRVTRHSYGDHPRQYLLCAMPPENKQNHPGQAVIFFHGGAWRFGSPEKFISYAKFFTSLGYTTFLPSYRRLPAFHFSHLHEDLVAMLGMVVNGETSAGKTQKLIAGGMSAGGHMAAILAQDASIWKKAGLSESPMIGLLACGAPLDLDQMPWSPVLLRLAGQRGSKRYQQANPVWHAGQSDARLPVLCIHGTADGLVPATCAHSFVGQAGQNPGANLTFHLIEDGTHLDAGRWVFREDAERHQIIKWLQML